MGTIIVYGLIIAHITAYKDHYANIGMMFCLTFLFKKLVKSCDSQDKSDFIGMGGYALTIGEVVDLIKDMNHSGFSGDPETTKKIVGGVLGSVLSGGTDWIKHLTGK